MARRGRLPGISVDPSRVRAARLAAGLSLADIASGQVSRTQIYFVEHGKSRPSQRVLELIARRTRKPVRFFVVSKPAAPEPPLSDKLSALAKHVRRFGGRRDLNHAEREAIKLIEVNLRQAALVARSLETRKK